MSLNTQTFDGIVRGAAAAIQGGVKTVLNLDIGSVLRASLEAIAGVALWLQGLVIQLLQTTRLSTSTGADVDSFVEDFGAARLPAVASIGAVQLSRFTPTNAATIPVGSLVQTTDGTQSFAIIADTTNAAYDATQNAYLVSAGVSSVSVSAQAVVAGSASNVLANTITVLQSPIVGIDTVNNSAAFTGGVDAETDDVLKARFPVFIAGLREGISAAVDAAISSLQQGIQHKTVENYAYDGTPQGGYFYVVISPYTSTLQQQVYAAIDPIRPLGVTFGVFAAAQVAATVSMTVVASAGYTHSAVAAAVVAAIESYIGTIALGDPLYWSKLYAIAYAVDGVSEVSALLLNGATSDLTATAQEAIVAGTVTVN